MKKLLLCFAFVSAVSDGWSFSGKSGFMSQKNMNLTQPQSDIVFSFFNAHRQGSNVISLMWRISGSENVLGFHIQRSYDGEFFDPATELPCNGGKRFTWEDNNVFPGYIYYRLAANLSDGTTIYSEVQVVHIVQK